MVVYWCFATARANLKVVSEWTVSVYDYECIVIFVHLQHYKNSETFSALWVILVFP